MDAGVATKPASEASIRMLSTTRLVRPFGFLAALPQVPHAGHRVDPEERTDPDPDRDVRALLRTAPTVVVERLGGEGARCRKAADRKARYLVDHQARFIGRAVFDRAPLPGMTRIDANLVGSMTSVAGVVASEIDERFDLAAGAAEALIELELPGVGVTVLDAQGHQLATRASGAPAAPARC